MHTVLTCFITWFKLLLKVLVLVIAILFQSYWYWYWQYFLTWYWYWILQYFLPVFLTTLLWCEYIMFRISLVFSMCLYEPSLKCIIDWQDWDIYHPSSQERATTYMNMWRPISCWQCSLHSTKIKKKYLHMKGLTPH